MSAKVVDTWSASQYNKIASFVYSADNTAPVLALLDPNPGDKIIDFGCGSGQITLELLKVVADAGIVVGVDSSQSMVGTSVDLLVQGYLFLIPSCRSTRPRKTDWKVPTSKISRHSMMCLRLSFWPSTGGSIRSSAAPFCTGANGILSASSAASRRF